MLYSDGGELRDRVGRLASALRKIEIKRDDNNAIEFNNLVQEKEIIIINIRNTINNIVEND